MRIVHPLLLLLDVFFSACIKAGRLCFGRIGRILVGLTLASVEGNASIRVRRSFFVLAFLTYSVTVQAQWSDTLWTVLTDLEQAKRSILLDSSGLYVDGSSFDFISGERSIDARNSISVNNFYYGDSAPHASGDSIGKLSVQSAVQVQRAQKLFGVDFNLGGFLYLVNGRVDNSRSGVIFGFDHRSYLRSQKERFGEWYADRERMLQRRQIELNPRLLAANTELIFEAYLAVLNDPTFQEKSERLLAQADSLRSLPGEKWKNFEGEFTEQAKAEAVLREQNLQEKSDSLRKQVDSLSSFSKDKLTRFQHRVLEKAEVIERLQRNYHLLVNRIKQHTHQLKSEARGIIDSCQQAFLNGPTSNVEDQLALHPKLTFWHKLLLHTKDFRLGNVNLPNDGVTSAGLPVKGIAYAYEASAYGVSLHHGKRIVSTHFTPRDGVPYHDLNNDFRLSQISLRLGNIKKNHYRISTLFANESETNANGLSLNFPRNNRVLTFSGLTKVREKFSLTTSVSHASTQFSASGSTSGRNLDDSDGKIWRSLSLRVGGTYAWENLDFSLVAFHTGALYQTLANPYLYTDYEGVEIRLQTEMFNNRLQGDFQLAFGGGTTEATHNNRRWRAQGFLRYQLNRLSSLSVLVSPNVYRYQVTGQESFTESSIYQLNFQQSLRVGGRHASINLGMTNLDQGWSWADSTRVAQAIVLRGSTQLAMSERWAVGFDGNYRFPDSHNTSQNPAVSREWYYALTSAIKGNWSVGFSLRYDKYRYEAVPAWGGNIDFSVPIGKIGMATVNIFYRPVQGSGDEVTARQVLGQQHLVTNF